MRSLIPKVETLIIGVFLLSVVLWGVSKCSATRAKYEVAANADAGVAEITDYSDEETTSVSTNTGSAVAAELPTNTTTPDITVSTPPTTPTVSEEIAVTEPVKPKRKPVLQAKGDSEMSEEEAAPAAATESNNSEYGTNGTKLYVVINGLKVRTEPKLNAKSLGKLTLYDQVTFLNQVTDFSQELSLGKEKANEPWVKIKTKRGTEGWVWGAGVSYYKKKRKGTW